MSAVILGEISQIAFETGTSIRGITQQDSELAADTYRFTRKTAATVK
jgi:hypothetical protein